LGLGGIAEESAYLMGVRQQREREGGRKEMREGGREEGRKEGRKEKVQKQEIAPRGIAPRMHSLQLGPTSDSSLNYDSVNELVIQSLL
jgi:predicted transposase YdaD